MARTLELDLKVTTDASQRPACAHMLIYLNGLTWTSGDASAAFASAPLGAMTNEQTFFPRKPTGSNGAADGLTAFLLPAVTKPVNAASSAMAPRLTAAAAMGATEQRRASGSAWAAHVQNCCCTAPLRRFSSTYTPCLGANGPCPRAVDVW